MSLGYYGKADRQLLQQIEQNMLGVIDLLEQSINVQKRQVEVLEKIVAVLQTQPVKLMFRFGVPVTK